MILFFVIHVYIFYSFIFYLHVLVYIDFKSLNQYKNVPELNRMTDFVTLPICWIIRLVVPALSKIEREF